MPIPRTLCSLTLLLVAAAFDAASAEAPAKVAVEKPSARQDAVAAPDTAGGRDSTADRTGDRTKDRDAADTGNHYDGDGGPDGLGGTYNGGGNDVP